FMNQVLAIVRRIPVGRVATYGDVAAMAGRPRAARAVGNIMRTCGRSDVPAHRVIAAGGRLGGYGGSEAPKPEVLIAERVPGSGRRVRDLDRVRWTFKAGKTGKAGKAGAAGRKSKSARRRRAR